MPGVAAVVALAVEEAQAAAAVQVAVPQAQPSISTWSQVDSRAPSVYEFQIDPTTGALTPLPNDTVDTKVLPISLAVVAAQ